MCMRLARIVKRKDGRTHTQTDNAKTVTPITDAGCNKYAGCNKFVTTQIYP